MSSAAPAYRIVKVQTPALCSRHPRTGRDWRFGAHNFVAVTAPDGAVLKEFHGIARGPGGAQLRLYGGVLPFREEYIWGETFEGRTGFYDEAHPQGALFAGPAEALEPRLRAAAALQAWVNGRRIRYPWPAAFGDNSNAYYSALIAAMGLADVRIKGELWAPSSRRRLAPAEVLAEIRGACLGELRADRRAASPRAEPASA